MIQSTIMNLLLAFELNSNSQVRSFKPALIWSRLSEINLLLIHDPDSIKKLSNEILGLQNDLMRLIKSHLPTELIFLIVNDSLPRLNLAFAYLSNWIEHSIKQAENNDFSECSRILKISEATIIGNFQKARKLIPEDKGLSIKKLCLELHSGKPKSTVLFKSDYGLRLLVSSLMKNSICSERSKWLLKNFSQDLVKISHKAKEGDSNSLLDCYDIFQDSTHLLLSEKFKTAFYVLNVVYYYSCSILECSDFEIGDKRFPFKTNKILLLTKQSLKKELSIDLDIDKISEYITMALDFDSRNLYKFLIPLKSYQTK